MKNIQRFIPLTTLILSTALFLATITIKLSSLSYAPISDSAMEPTYHSGDLVFIASETPSDLKVNDIVAYKYTNSNCLYSSKNPPVIACDDQEQTIRLRRLTSTYQYSSTGNYEFFAQADNIIAYPGYTTITDQDLIGKAIFSLPLSAWLASPIALIILPIIALASAYFFIGLSRAHKISERKVSHNSPLQPNPT